MNEFNIIKIYTIFTQHRTYWTFCGAGTPSTSEFVVGLIYVYKPNLPIEYTHLSHNLATLCCAHFPQSVNSFSYEFHYNFSHERALFTPLWAVLLMSHTISCCLNQVLRVDFRIVPLSQLIFSVWFYFPVLLVKPPNHRKGVLPWWLSQ